VIAGRCKQVTDKPVLVGVGVSTPDQAAQVSQVADGCVVGTAIVRRLIEGRGAEGVGELVGELRAALDAV
jgi:tryptophan synthase alpha chain